MIKMTNKHTSYDLKQMQSVPLEGKIIMTKERIRQWYEHWEGQVYVSFSGGKDSTVLKHIVDGMYSDVPSVFVNTGLEYPEIQQFVIRVKNGEFDCFNSDVEIIRPEMRFDEVIKKYGYPVISKTVSNVVQGAKKGSKTRLQRLNGEYLVKNGKGSIFNCKKWNFMLSAPYEISDKCCHVMKKKPLIIYENKTGRNPLIGMLASESIKRELAWIKTGCNAFDMKKPQSQPLAFWTEQDILHYLKKYNVPYCSVYGDIVEEEKQIDLFGDEVPKLLTTGCNRTGCIFCMFGCHLEKEPNRFQRLKETHPKQYDFCINGGEYNEEGMWQPNKEGLGIGKVLDYINVKY